MFFAKGKRCQALDDFVQNIYSAESMSAEESKASLESSLVEIIRDGQHSSNGILITDDGYFMTAAHCMHKKQKIRTADGREYAVETRYLKSKSEDIAIGKAKIRATPNAKRYKFYNSDNIPERSQIMKEPVVLVTRWNGEIGRTGGWMMTSASKYGVNNSDGTIRNYPDQFTSHLESKPGDSGGVIVTADGRLVGVHSNGAPGFPYSGHVKLFRALDLVVYLRNNL